MSPLLVLIVAVLATTYAGPIVRFAVAPALAIAFWRLALVLPVTGVLAAREGTAAPLRRGTPMLMTLAGLLLALHFWSWIASLRYTAVASSVVLVSLKSVFAWVIAALWLRERPTRREAWGIVLAVVGASLIGVGDAQFSFGALGGDGLALLGSARPMLIGHTGMNYALRYFRATTVNVAALGEPVGATLLAWLIPAIHEPPRATAVVGGVLVLVGIGLSLGARE